jgi:hypothetical protein
MVRHDLPTPPPPTTTSLYSRKNYESKLAIEHFHLAEQCSGTYVYLSRPSFRSVLHQVDLINASSGSSVEDLTLASVLITRRKELYSPLTPWRILCDIITLRGSRSCIDCECTALDPAPPETEKSACAERVAQIKMSRLRRRRHREQVDYADARSWLQIWW